MRFTSLTRSGLHSLILALLLAACNLLPKAPTPQSRGGWLDWDGSGGWRSATSTEKLSETAAPTSELAREAPSSEKEVGSDALEASRSEKDLVEHPPGQPPDLRAGSVDDNAQWDDYLHYRQEFAGWNVSVHDVDVSERHIIEVTNPQGDPVLGAQVTISDDQRQEIAVLQTHADGRVLFFPLASSSPNAPEYGVRVQKNQAENTFTLDRSQRTHAVTLSARPAPDPIRLDVHFLIDATGSMSDEIQRLKENMVTVSERIHELPQQPDVRFGMTIYRDRGDLFVSRTYDFTPDVKAFTEELQQIAAEGGGDYPESLNEGLHNAIHMPEWRLEETVSLLFLVADAPPHLDYEQDFDYAAEVLEAATRGIKIFPLASSGLDDQGEYIYRQLAQITSGKFLFLTYGPGGAPGDETTHHVDDYSVLSLDELIVRMVEEELATLPGQQ